MVQLVIIAVTEQLIVEVIRREDETICFGSAALRALKEMLCYATPLLPEDLWSNANIQTRINIVATHYIPQRLG